MNKNEGSTYPVIGSSFFLSTFVSLDRHVIEFWEQKLSVVAD